ncbi:iron uptake protein [Allohahella marinimesophila]|uniref:Iron uptake protein n=1 Tax=Allohahella marinimesophila TaxID=1054972 RepID=A0ABP7PZ93_9GAMM
MGANTGISKAAVNPKAAGKGSGAVFDTLHRLVLSLLGSYCFTWGFVAFGIAGLVTLGVSFHGAEHLMMMLAFLLIVPVFLWAFVTPDLRRVWIVLAGGAIGMTATAWLLQLLLID